MSTFTFEAQQKLEKSFSDDRKEEMQSNKTQNIIPKGNLRNNSAYLFGDSKHVILRFRVRFVVANHFVSREFHKQLKIYLLIFNKDDNGNMHATPPQRKKTESDANG